MGKSCWMASFWIYMQQGSLALPCLNVLQTPNLTRLFHLEFYSYWPNFNCSCSSMIFLLTLNLLLISEIMFLHIVSKTSMQLKFKHIAAPLAKGRPFYESKKILKSLQNYCKAIQTVNEYFRFDNCATCML